MSAKTEWLSPAGLRSQVQIQSSQQGLQPPTSGESVAGSSGISQISQYMLDGITHVVQTEREDASVYPDQLHSYESRRLPLIMTLSVIHAAAWLGEKSTFPEA